MEFSVNSLEEMCDLMCGNVEREEENMLSQKFTNNVVTILKHDGVKVGTFEKELGLSTGYLSRITKQSVKSISLDLAQEIADAIELSIEEIITTDWVKTFEEEDRMAKIQQLEAEQQRIATMLQELRS